MNVYETNRRPRFTGVVIGTALLTVCFIGVGAAADDAFEQPPTLNASEILPEALFSSDHHNVSDSVVNDGYLNTYTINSDYGEFSATGDAMLAIRVWEVHALARLDELSKTKVFMDAVKEGAMGQVTTLVEFAQQPVATVKGIPGGVKRLFKRTQRDVKEGMETVKEVLPGGDSDDEKSTAEALGVDGSAAEVTEDLAKRYMDVDKAEREWSERLGTDPYTSNETLKKSIEKIAWVDRIGSFGVKLAGIPRIPGVSHVRRVNKVVWSKDPRELRDHNEARLREAGADEELIAAFFSNRYFSPTDQTRFIELVVRLEGVDGREAIVERASTVESEEQARFYAASVGMLLWYQNHHEGARRVAPGYGIPITVDETGSMTAFAAVDHLCWTNEIADFVGALSAESRPDAAAEMEVWLFGSISDRCRREMEALGWVIHTDLRAKLAGFLAASVEKNDAADSEG